jgi:hypothetical protein
MARRPRKFFATHRRTGFVLSPPEETEQPVVGGPLGMRLQVPSEHLAVIRAVAERQLRG